MKNPLTTPDQSGETLGEAIIAALAMLAAIPAVLGVIWLAVAV